MYVLIGHQLKLSHFSAFQLSWQVFELIYIYVYVYGLILSIYMYS